MVADRYYKPGSHYKICDVSGFKTRAGDTRKEWQGLVVDKRFYEERQPQDYVKGVRDDQTVPDARPRPKDVFVFLATYATAPALINAQTISVASGVGFTQGMPVQVMLDNGAAWFTWISSATGTTLTFTGGLPLAMAGIFNNQVLSIGAADFVPYLVDDNGNLITDQYGRPIQLQ